MIFVIASCNFSNTKDLSNNECFIAFIFEVLSETLFKENTIITIYYKRIL